MSRPAFSLSEDEARRLVAELAPILERHPVGARSHRPFVREFIRAVHTASGHTCSPVLYRRLLDVYAPGRTPSTAILDQEKKAFVAALAQQSGAERGRVVSRNEVPLAEVVQRAVDDALARQPYAVATDKPAGDATTQAQQEGLLAQLAATEQRLHDAETRASRLAAELQAIMADRDAAQRQLTAAEVERARTAENAAQWVHEVGEQRSYALRAIDAAQGETRAWKEHCASLEHQLVQVLQQLEMLRHAASTRGGDSDSDQPDLLPKESPK